MTTNLSRIIITQVYYFIKERPSSENQEQSILINEYFKELHEGHLSNYRFENGKQIWGKFGNIYKVDITSCPRFMDKPNFIDWTIKHLNL